MFMKILFFPHFGPLLSEPFVGFMMPHTVIGHELYAPVFLGNYSPKEEEFCRNALQTDESSGDDRTLHR